jgi:hypothetical protein
MRRALAAVLLVCASALACHSPAAVDETELLQVQSLEVLVAQSLPAQVTVRVHGLLPSGCSSVGSVSQMRSGNTWDLVITVHRSSELCTQAIRDVEQAVRLEGALSPGKYLVRANGVQQAFTI